MPLISVSLDPEVRRDRVPASAGSSTLVILLLVITDLTSLVLAGGLGYWVSTLVLGATERAPASMLFPCLVPFVLFFAVAGLYPGYGVGPVEQLRRFSIMTTLGTSVLAGSPVLFQARGVLPFSALLVGWFFALATVPCTRALARWRLASSAFWGVPVLVAGGHAGEGLARRLLQNSGLGLRPVALLGGSAGPQREAVVRPITLAELPTFVSVTGARTLFVATPDLADVNVVSLVNERPCILERVVFTSDSLGIVCTTAGRYGRAGLVTLSAAQGEFWFRLFKRALDLAVAVPLLLVASPLILVAAGTVKLCSPGSAFYFQEREGLHGRRIRVWKIRTMVPEAEKVLQAYLDSSSEARTEWEQYMKLRNDPRVVPRVGKILRRFSIDELPQLVNIVCGEMSLVGPRPFPDYHLACFSQEFRKLRRSVLPGLTGLWQVSARSDGDLKVQEELDSAYIRHWSLWLDLYLLARTFSEVFFGAGAY